MPVLFDRSLVSVVSLLKASAALALTATTAAITAIAATKAAAIPTSATSVIPNPEAIVVIAVPTGPKRLLNFSKAVPATVVEPVSSLNNPLKSPIILLALSAVVAFSSKL
ncbi:MAG: hypothetical protein FD167_3463 [bacterium]|nr:MAG: hypothetical protein FD167_3463 [bacterium]